ncbi:hypothetical protein [Streptomyces sp. NPDC090021]|uniref:hypothetical protein n=1 Tax=Streptomyces sp. NPDC090021 TaxID=3365919 RepID=UPI0037F1D343
MNEASEPGGTPDQSEVTAAGSCPPRSVAVNPLLGDVLRDLDPFAQVRAQIAELSVSLVPQKSLGRLFADAVGAVSILPQMERSLGAVGGLASAQDAIRRLVDSGSMPGTVASLQSSIAALAKPAPLPFELPKSVLYSITRSQVERNRTFADIAAKALGPSLARPILSEQLRANPVQFQPVPLALTGLFDSAPWRSVLAQVGERNRLLLTSGLLDTFSKFAVGIKDLLPENLEALRIEDWAKLFAICEEDGVCLIWAPRTEHIEGLLALPGRTERQQYLVEHHLDIVDDVLGSLAAVDHPELLDLVELARDAANSVRDGHYRPAQALLGNILDTTMGRHGHTWLRATFPLARFTSRRRNPGSNTVLAEARDALPAWGELQALMFVPALMVSGMMKAFAKTDREQTFNRHLAAHEASTAAYRIEFALSSLLIVQALLRQIDQHLYAIRER